MDKKLNIVAIPVVVLVCVEVSVGLLLGTSTAFWIETAFSMAATVLFVFSLLHGAPKGQALFGLSKSFAAGGIFVIQLGLTIVGAALGDTAIRVVPILSLLTFGGGVAFLLAGNASQTHTTVVEKDVAEATSYMKNLRLQLELLHEEAADELKLVVAEALDAAKYANPMSGEATKAVESKIDAELISLSGAIKADDRQAAQARACQITALIHQRETIVKGGLK